MLSTLLIVAPAWAGVLVGTCFGVPLIINMFLCDPERFGREGSRARTWKPRVARLDGIGTLLVLPIGLSGRPTAVLSAAARAIADQPGSFV